MFYTGAMFSMDMVMQFYVFFMCVLELYHVSVVCLSALAGYTLLLIPLNGS